MLHDFSALPDYPRQLDHAHLSAGLAPEHQAVLKRAVELSELAARAGQGDWQPTADAGHSDGAAAGLASAAAAAAAVVVRGTSGDESAVPGAAPPLAPRAALGAALAATAGVATAARTPPPAQSGSGLGRDYMDNVLEAASKFVFMDHADMNWHHRLASEYRNHNKSPVSENGVAA